VHAAATYLKTFQALSYERLQGTFLDLFGLSMRISRHRGHGFQGIVGSDFTASRAPVLAGVTKPRPTV